MAPSASETKAEATKIAARCRRIGWKVLTGQGRAAYHYRIMLPATLPDGAVKVDIHRTPSDINWQEHIFRVLNAAGFDEAEQKWLAEQEVKRQAKLENDRRRNEAKTKEMEGRSKALAAAAGPLAAPQPVDLKWLTTPTDTPQTRTVIMTPQVARHVLDTMNTHNRQLRPAHVDWLVQIITDGEWAATHQGGAIDSDGVLQDGQHRLEAIYRTGKSLPMQWSIGMDPANFRKVDTNKIRNGRDTAYVRGEADPSTISATAKMLIVLDLFGPDAHVKYKSYRVTNDKVDRTIESMGDDLRNAVAQAKDIKRELKKINPSALASAIYLIRKRLPEGDPRVDMFFEQLKYGEGIDRTYPVWHMRRLLERKFDGRRGYNAWETLAYLLTTWKKYAQGDTDIVQLVWRPKTQPFPASVFLPPPLPQKAAQKAAQKPLAAVA